MKKKRSILKSEETQPMQGMNNSKGSLVRVKAHQSGALIYINPPPNDMRCEICGRKADDLEMFTNKIVDVYEQTDKEFEDLKQNPGCKIISITTDHKLIKNFRRLKGDIIEASWECTDCFYLSTEEAVARKIGHRQAYN